MFKLVLLALAMHTALHGLGTYYGPPAFCEGDGMRNGKPLRLDGATVAVDATHWPQWADARAIVFVPG